MSSKNSNNSVGIIANTVQATESLICPNYTSVNVPSATSQQYGSIIFNSSNSTFYGVTMAPVFQPVTISAANLNNVVSFSIGGSWTIPDGTYSTIQSFETALENTLLTTAFVEYSSIDNKWKFKMKNGLTDIIQTVPGTNDNLTFILGYGTSSLVSPITFTPMPFTSNLYQNQQTFSQFAQSSLPPSAYWKDAGLGNIQNANLSKVLIDMSAPIGNGSLQTSSLSIRNISGTQGFCVNDIFGNVASLSKVPVSFLNVDTNLDMSGFSISGIQDVSSQKLISNNCYLSQGLFPNFLSYTAQQNILKLNPDKSVSASGIFTDELIINSNIVVNNPHHLRTNNDTLSNQHDVVNRTALWSYAAPTGGVLYLTGSTQNVQKMVQIWNAINPGSYNENLRLPETNGYSTIVMGDGTSNSTGMTHDSWGFLRSDNFYGKRFQIRNAGNIIASYAPTSGNFGYNITPSTTFKYNINPDLVLAEGNSNGSLYFGSNAHYLRRDSGTNDLRLKTTSGNLYFEGVDSVFKSGVEISPSNDSYLLVKSQTAGTGSNKYIRILTNDGAENYTWWVKPSQRMDMVYRNTGGADYDYMTFLPNGNIGINDNNPQNRFDVGGNMRVQGLIRPRVKGRIKFSGGVYSIDNDYDNIGISSVATTSTGVCTITLSVTLSTPYDIFQVTPAISSGVFDTCVLTNTTTVTVYGWSSTTIADSHSFFISCM